MKCLETFFVTLSNISINEEVPMKNVIIHSRNPNKKGLTRCGVNGYHVRNSANLARVTCKSCLNIIRGEKAGDGREPKATKTTKDTKTTEATKDNREST